MIFFRDNAPPIEDYDKTLNELIDLGWIQKIYNVEMNKSIYDMTSLGYQYYFAICMKASYTQMFGGPTLTEGQTTEYINEDNDLVEEGYLIDGIDSVKLTPTAAEYLYVLTDAHGKEVKVKKQKNNQQKNSSTASKIGVGMMKFMKGIQQASKVAQEYDKIALSGETWHAYSLFIPKDTPQINSEWITMGQFHNLDYHKPPVNLDLVGKNFEIVTRFLCIHPKRFNKKCYSDDPENVRKIIIRKDQLFGKWNDFTFHSKWSTKVDKGFFKAWVNGKLVYHFEGRTKAPKDGTMFKFGIYRGAAPKGTKDSIHVAYYDEIRYVKKSCKKLKLKDLGYTCKELENQKLEKIHTIK